MKKTRLASLAALLMLSAFAHAAKSCPELVITGHPDYVPVAWAEGGRITGAAPELVTDIARKLGVKTVISKDYGAWERAQAAVRDGEADVIFGIYRNDERLKWLDYVEPPFMMDPVAVAVRRGDGFDYAKWDDLKGRRGITNAGESFGNAFDRFMASSLTVTRAQGVDKAFDALLDKRADYLIIGLYPGRNEARKLGIAQRVAFLPTAVVSQAMYVGFSKKSKCNALKADFARSLRQAVAAGRVQPLLDAAQKRAE
jgi:polar amino acid transport system substrate-binding protein